MRWLLISMLGLAGCGVLSDNGTPAAVVGEGRVGVSPEILVRPQSRPAEKDMTVETVPEAATGVLGVTVASLGDASQPGLWLKTPLVRAEQVGQVRYPVSGKVAQVTLIPIDGPLTAGSRLSLAAMQAIGAPLTELPEIEVSAAG